MSFWKPKPRAASSSVTYFLVLVQTVVHTDLALVSLGAQFGCNKSELHKTCASNDEFQLLWNWSGTNRWKLLYTPLRTPPRECSQHEGAVFPCIVRKIPPGSKYRSTSGLSYTCFNAILPNHPTLSLSHRVQKTVLYICVSFSVSHCFLKH